MKKRLLSALLALCLVLGMIPTTLLTSADAATPTEIPSFPLSLGTNYSAYSNITTPGMPVMTAAHLTGLPNGLRVSSVAGNWDPATSRGSSATTYQAGKVPYIKLTFQTTSNAFRIQDGATVTLPGSWTQQGTAVRNNNGTSLTVEYTYGNTPLNAISQTVGFTHGLTGTENANNNSAAPTITITEGQTHTWKPYANYVNYASITTDSTSITYTTSNNQVATASASGIRAVKPGVCTITLTARAVNGLLAESSFTVNVEVVSKETLTITGASSVTWAVTPAQLNLGVTPAGTGNPVSYTWESSNPNVLSILGSGLTATATAVAKGSATVTVKAWSEADGQGALLGTATRTITVNPLQVLTPKAGTRTVPFEDASSVITGNFAYTELKEFFDALTHCQGSATIALNNYYTLSGKPTSYASTYQITATLIDPNNTVWEGTSGSAPMVFTFNVTAKPISDINSASGGVSTAPTDAVYYTGEDAKPVITLYEGTTQTPGNELVEGQDYTVSCSEVYVKQDALVTVTGINNYTGTKNFYFDINPVDCSVQVNGQDVLSVNGNGYLYATKGQTIDLRKAIISQYDDIDVTKLNGLTFELASAASKQKATLTNGYSLRLNNTLGKDEAVVVNVNLPTTTYNVGGSDAAEYYNLSITNKQITIVITNSIKTVPIPTAATGLVYNGKEQVGVADGQYYNCGTSVVASDGLNGKATNARYPGKTANANYSTTVSLDLNSVSDGTTLVWADGTTTPKTLTWTIAPAKITGNVTFTEIKSDGYNLDDAGLTGYFYDVNGNLFDIKANPAKEGEATLEWVVTTAVASTPVVKDASYGWVLTPYNYDDDPSRNNSNYEKVTGSAILYGSRAGATTDASKPQTGTTTTTRTNPDYSTTVIETNHDTGVATYTTTSLGNRTDSVVVYTNGTLTSATATNSGASGSIAYIPLQNVTWGSVALVNGAANYDAAVPADGLGGMWVSLPTGTSAITVRDASRYFPDVAANQWYAPGVNFASARGLIQGDNGYFKPSDTLNYGQIWTMLGRYTGQVSMAQSSGANWYVAGQDWAYRNGISNSSYQSYSAGASREDLAVMLYNTYSRFVMTPSVNTSNLYNITDYASVSADARTAVAWCVQTGIIKGFPDGSFRGSQTIQRDAAALMMARFSYVALGQSIPSTLAV